MKRLLSVFLLVGALAAPAAAQINVPNTLVAGQTIRASELNTNFTTLGNSALNRLSGGNLSGNVTADVGVTIDGIDIGATVCTGCSPTFKNLTLSAPTTGLTVNSVNIVNSSGKIPAISSTYFTSLDGSNLTGLSASALATGTVPAARLGSGTPDSTTYLRGDNAWTTINSVPSGLIAFSVNGTCPSGWTEYTTARGRYIVGLVSGGTNGATVGTSLSNSEDRATGQHTHGVTDPGHTHAYYVAGGSASQVYFAEQGFSDTSTFSSTAMRSATTGISINNAGSVAGTNAPYVQLIACQKS